METRQNLGAAPDLSRALSRLVVGRGGPRDLVRNPRRHRGRRRDLAKRLKR
jgi:DNA mismatch repair ATPase MutS